MNELITWYINLMVSVWNFIASYWLLSIFFMIGILNWIIDIYLGSREN